MNHLINAGIVAIVMWGTHKQVLEYHYGLGIFYNCLGLLSIIFMLILHSKEEALRNLSHNGNGGKGE